MEMTKTWTLVALLAGLLAVSACSSSSKDKDDDAGMDTSEDTEEDTGPEDDDTGPAEDDETEAPDRPDGTLSETDGVLVIEDFEGYADDAALAVYYPRVLAGNDITFSLDEDNKNGGEYGCRIDFTLGTSTEADSELDTDEVDLGIDYAGVYRTLSQDWQGAALVRFWVDADVMGRVIVVQFQDVNGNYWEYEYPVESVDPYIAEITMDTFVVPPWFADSGQEMDLSGIFAFNLYMRGTPGESTIYVDDFEVVDEATAGLDTDSDTGMPEDTDSEITDDAGVTDDAGTTEDTDSDTGMTIDTDSDTGMTEDTGSDTGEVADAGVIGDTDTDTGMVEDTEDTSTGMTVDTDSDTVETGDTGTGVNEDAGMILDAGETADAGM